MYQFKYLFQMKDVQTNRIGFMNVPLIVTNDGLLEITTRIRVTNFSVRTF